MTGELKILAAMKDPQAQGAAAHAFRRKWMKEYTAVLSKADISMTDEVAKLKKIIPAYNILLSEGQIIAKQAAQTPAAQTAAGPKTQKITGLHDETSGGCGLGAGGSVTFTASSVKAFALAVLGGGCSNKGTKSKDLAIGNVNSASITAKFKGSLDGLAIGLGGSSFSTPSAVYKVGNGAAPFYLSATYFAPVLWVASGSETFDKEITTALPKNQTTHVEFYTRVYVATILAPETHGGANITNIDLTLKTN